MYILVKRTKPCYGQFSNAFSNSVWDKNITCISKGLLHDMLGRFSTVTTKDHPMIGVVKHLTPSTIPEFVVQYLVNS